MYCIKEVSHISITISIPGNNKILEQTLHPQLQNRVGGFWLCMLEQLQLQFRSSSCQDATAAAFGLQLQLFQRLPDSLEVQLELQSKLLLQRLLDSLEVQLKLQLQLSESAAVQLLHPADVDQLQPLSLVLMTAFLCLIES